MNILEAMIGWLAPPPCIRCGIEGSSLCMACAAAEITPFDARCWRCSALSEGARTCKSCRRPDLPRYVWISTTYDGAAKDLVQKYKFGQQRAAANVLVELMEETLLSFNSKENLQQMNYLVVPVPTATSRVRQRGFDHSILLARKIAQQLKLDYRNALVRMGQMRQVGAKRSERLTQSADNYCIRKPERITNRNVLLVDDVVTTGSTLKAAGHELRNAGASRVDALVFAKRL